MIAEILVLGDVIDWGPNSRDCVQQLIDLSNRCHFVLVRGNHEEMLFAALESESDLRSWLDLGGEQTLMSYPYRGGDDFIDPDHVQFLKANARDFFETTDFIFVHASYNPTKPMAEQSNTTLQWEFVEPEKMRPHCSAKTVIAGHTPQTSGEVLDLGHLVCIDTYCHGGGWLTALDVGSGRWWQANQQGEVREGRLASATSEPVATREQPST